MEREKIASFLQNQKNKLDAGIKDLGNKFDDIRVKLPRAAIDEMVKSQLPGRESGPADAYRHLQWVGKTAEKYGKDTALGVGTIHELEGGISSPSLANYRMDAHNNAIAAEIGDRVYRGEITSEQAQKLYQEAIRDGQMMDADGNLTNPDGKGAAWLPIDAWKKNPKFDDIPEVPPELRGQEMPIGNTNWPNPDFENPGQYNPYAPNAPATETESPTIDATGPTPSHDFEREDEIEVNPELFPEMGGKPLPDIARTEAVPDTNPDQETAQKFIGMTVGDELRARLKLAREQGRVNPNTPDPNEIDPVTGKKFGEMRAGEYAAALYRKRAREQANDNAVNDNRATNSSGSVQVSAHDREGGRESVRAYTRQAPKK